MFSGNPKPETEEAFGLGLWTEFLYNAGQGSEINRGWIRMNRTIAVLDDEEDILKLIRINLEGAGFGVETFADPEDFFKSLHSRRPDLVILDLMLPGTDGLDIFRMMKKNDAWKAIPVIMLTARASEADRVIGLEMGADDYIVKPFSARELVARVRAVLRRPEGADEARLNIRIADGLMMARDRHEVTSGGKQLDLTSTEFKLLEMLALAPGRVFSRDQILDRLWGETRIVTDRTIDVHVRNLRRKLGPYGDVIKSLRGTGYKLEP
jgi:DNA-binding response OmpR family regulator